MPRKTELAHSQHSRIKNLNERGALAKADPPWMWESGTLLECIPNYCLNENKLNQVASKLYFGNTEQ